MQGYICQNKVKLTMLKTEKGIQQKSTMMLFKNKSKNKNNKNNNNFKN